MVNEEPQPQVEVAFGFLIVNPPPVTVSTKSTSAPLRYRMLIGSTIQLDAVRLEDLVGVAAVFFDHQPVLEARAPSTLHEDAQTAVLLLFFGQKLGDFGGC